MDIASYALLDEALQGEGLTCEIHFCKTDKGVNQGMYTKFFENGKKAEEGEYDALVKQHSR